MEPDLPTPKKRAAPITPEDPAVKAAGERELEEQQRRQGRGSLFFTNPAMKTGFSGGSGYGQNTGSV
jgi:hypothetical protein